MDVATKFPNFENEGNSCWLDSCMILIAHNETFKKNVKNCQNSQILKIVNDYHQALGILNAYPKQRTALKKSRSILTSLQKTTSKYLKKFLKFSNGQFESAMCALLSLVIHDKAMIKQHFETSLIWHKQCSNCNAYSTSIIKEKTIVTLPKVVNFNPTAPTTCYTCVCKKLQEMKGEIKETSDCLIYHFENGAGKGDTLPSQFFINKRKYHLTCMIIFQDSKGLGKDHFITWVRQPFVDRWLEFNDMEDTVVYFSEVKPKLKMQNIYIAVYEAFDNLGKTKIGTFSNEDISASNQSIETIHLVDDPAPSPVEDNILITTHKSLYKHYVNEPPTSDDEHYQRANSVSPDATSSETDKDRYFGDDLDAEPKEENKFWLDPSKMKIVDDAVQKTFAAFFGQIMMINENSFKTSDDEHYQRANSVSPDATNSETDKDRYFGDDLHAGNEQNYFKISDDEHYQRANSVSPDVTSSETDKDRNFGDDLDAESKEENKFWLDPSKMKIVDDAVQKTFAAFFGQIMMINENSFKTSDDEHYQRANSVSPDATNSETDKDRYFGDDLHAGNEQNYFKTSDDEHYQRANSVSPDATNSETDKDRYFGDDLHAGNEQNYFKTSDDEHYQRANSVSPDVTISETDKDRNFGDDLDAESKEENKFWLDPSKMKIIDDAVQKTFAAFFGQIMMIDAKREAAVDSESSSGNEENIMTATYKLLDKNCFNSERDESPCNSSTNSSFHPENEQVDCTNSASSDSTETDSKDLYFSDDSHTEKGKMRRNL